MVRTLTRKGLSKRAKITLSVRPKKVTSLDAGEKKENRTQWKRITEQENSHSNL